MSSSVVNPYTPPPPEKPSSLALKAIDYPISATPLPPSPSTARSTTSTISSSALQAHSGSSVPQIRYCYFISAASVAPNRSGNPSLDKKPVYLTPHVQEPMESSSPNCTQPRTYPPKDTSGSVFILGPHPPQIQLQFLEDQPLPPPTPSDVTGSTDKSNDTTASAHKESPDVVSVERKDSGYGGSVSRSSSLAAFGRGIRKVFWRNTHKGAVESIVVTDPPVLDYGIPQDVLDHEGWAQDLAEKLTLASAPDAVTAWLGQLPTPGIMDTTSSLVQDVVQTGLGTAERPVATVEETTGRPELPSSKSELSLHHFSDTPASTASTTSNQTATPSPAEKSLRRILSSEQLNKPQPPLPLDAVVNKPVPSIPSSYNSSTTSTSPFNSISCKLTVATEHGFGKGSEKSMPQRPRRPNLHEIFQESASESIIRSSRRSKEGRLSIESVEELLDEADIVTSPEEMEGSHYLSVQSSSKRANRFFKSLSSLTATEFKSAPQSEVRPLSEVLLTDSNFRPNEASTEVVLASRSSSLRVPPSRRAVPQWDVELSPASLLRKGKERSGSSSLAPPKPLFYNRRVASSVSSLGEVSSCGSVESSAMDSSADEWDGLTRMAQHAKEQNARYTADLKGLQALLHQADPSRYYTPTHSANTSTGSLTLPSVPPSPSKKETKTTKALSKKDDYMSHRMSGCSPKLMPVSKATKPRSKSRLSMTYGGGEQEIVKHAKFDTPEAMTRNKEIRKFISQEIYTTELNYLQYLRTIQEVYVEPLMKSFETDKPFIPKSSPLFHLLAHVSALISVASQVAQRLGDCVRDEVWSDESSLVGTIFLDFKEPLTIFLKYGQSYGKGMKALRALMKSKRTSVAVTPTLMPTMGPSGAGSRHLAPESPRMDKRRSLPSIFSLNTAPGAPSSILLDSSWSKSSSGSGHMDANKIKTSPKPRSSLGMPATTATPSEYDLFLINCVGGKETTSRFSLADLLILPIQRVTRYCLLLRDLKKHTDVEHKDYVCIVHALEQLHTLALATNNVQPSLMRM
ncbi:Rho guanine nucleotide exchange factor (GEF) 17 [Mortierella claussenii]|nr:Rho guanine nucleotide exchange factor (GEF) 17 [Mortierella claussenii]